MVGDSLFAWRTEKKTPAETEEMEYRPYKRYVQKQRIPVVVCTPHHRIEGILHVTYHHRALDILNGQEAFVPLTAAKIYNLATDALISEQPFVALNKESLVLLYEVGEPLPPDKEADSEAAEPSEGTPVSAAQSAQPTSPSPPGPPPA